MNVAEKMLSETSMTLMDGDAKKAKEDLVNGLKDIGLGDDVIKGFQSFFASKIISQFGSGVSFGQMLSRTTGQVLNPNLVTVFWSWFERFYFRLPVISRDKMKSKQ